MDHAIHPLLAMPWVRPQTMTVQTGQIHLEESFSARIIGKRIGMYRITREIGRGGMGAVFEAVHENIGQRAAVKVLHAEFSREPRYVQRFFDEARAVSMVQHAGLVKIFDLNQMDEGIVFILMEFLEGESLYARMERLLVCGQRLALGSALQITRQIASALSAVHEKGIVHRDLKPENVILVPDRDSPSGERAKIVDFGIAKFVNHKEGERRTTEGKVLGTAVYMSPEQCDSRDDIDDRADVYSLGVMLYEMLAGRPPFIQEGWLKLMVAHVLDTPPPLRSLAPRIPEETAALVHDMLAKEAAPRPTMSQVMERIDGMRVQKVGPTGTSGAVPVPASRGWVRFGVGAALLLLLTGATALVLLRSHPPASPPVAQAPPLLPPPAPAPTGAPAAVVPAPKEAEAGRKPDAPLAGKGVPTRPAGPPHRSGRKRVHDDDVSTVDD